MEAIAEGFQWLIDTVTQAWEFLMNMISGLILALRCVAQMTQMAIETIANFPDWLQAFGIITITICGIYIVVGREAGKTE